MAPGAQDVLLPYGSSAVTGRVETFPKEACLAFRNSVQASGSQIMLFVSQPCAAGVRKEAWPRDQRGSVHCLGSVEDGMG